MFLSDFFCKENANERNESLLSNCRVQLFFCKENANERNESLLSNCRVQLFFCKDNGISVRLYEKKCDYSLQSFPQSFPISANV